MPLNRSLGKLKNLRITRIDRVAEGANSGAAINLWKADTATAGGQTVTIDHDENLETESVELAVEGLRKAGRIQAKRNLDRLRAAAAALAEVLAEVEADKTEKTVKGPTGQPVTDAPWDGTTARFSDDEYAEAVAGRRGTSDAIKADGFLPHHEPDGSLSRKGLFAAAARISQVDAPPAAKAAAIRHLARHYRADLNQDDLPAVLKTAVATMKGDT